MPKLFLKVSQFLSLLSLLDRHEMFRQSRTVMKEKDVTEGEGGGLLSNQSHNSQGKISDMFFYFRQSVKHQHHYRLAQDINVIWKLIIHCDD